MNDYEGLLDKLILYSFNISSSTLRFRFTNIFPELQSKAVSLNLTIFYVTMNVTLKTTIFQQILVRNRKHKIKF